MNHVDNQSVKFNIRKLREQMNLTQEAMADLCGISISNYVRIESGPARLISKSLEQIAEAAHVPLETLLTGDRHGSVGDLLSEERALYQHSCTQLTEQYESRIHDLQEKISLQEELIASFRTTITTQSEMIEMLKKQNLEEK